MMPRFYTVLRSCWQHQQPCTVSHLNYQEPHKILCKQALYSSQTFVSVGYLWNFCKRTRNKNTNQREWEKKPNVQKKRAMKAQNNYAGNALYDSFIFNSIGLKFPMRKTIFFIFDRAHKIRKTLCSVLSIEIANLPQNKTHNTAKAILHCSQSPVPYAFMYCEFYQNL